MIPKVEHFQPWADRFLVEPKERPKETDGGVIIADTVALQTEEGIVRGVGELIDCSLVGKTVLYSPNTAWPLTVNGVAMKVIRKEFIEGTVD